MYAQCFCEEEILVHKPVFINHEYIVSLLIISFDFNALCSFTDLTQVLYIIGSLVLVKTSDYGRVKIKF